jgi:hypothetical protein
MAASEAPIGKAVGRPSSEEELVGVPV